MPLVQEVPVQMVVPDVLIEDETVESAEVITRERSGYAVAGTQRLSHAYVDLQPAVIERQGKVLINPLCV